MDILVFLPLAFFAGFQLLKAREQRRRIYLLGAYLSQYQIEKLMENVTEGYLRALDENDEERRAQIWSMLATAEQELASQFRRFSEDFAKVWNGQTQVSTLGFAFPYADRILPRQTFDMRHLLAVHAEGITATAENRMARSLRDKAYTMTAELLLMQHSCHWFCRSRAVASARVQARHQTSHAQLIASVSPETRAAYGRLTGC
jgi:predicted DCC family thiol-disulfide oxidoreductase YuxK